METYYGHVRTPADAIILFEACRLGRLPRVQRRLSEKERQAIRSGSVFVWDEREAGMRRWTDGKSWSASRVSGSFLTYREMEGKRGTMTPSGRTSDNPQGGSAQGSESELESFQDDGAEGFRYKNDGLTKQSFSITTSAGSHLHLISYFARMHLHAQQAQLEPQGQARQSCGHDSHMFGASKNTRLSSFHGVLPLITPSSDPALRQIRPAKGMYPDSTLIVAEHQTSLATDRSPRSRLHSSMLQNSSQPDPPLTDHHDIQQQASYPLTQRPMGHPQQHHASVGGRTYDISTSHRTPSPHSSWATPSSIPIHLTNNSHLPQTGSEETKTLFYEPRARTHNDSGVYGPSPDHAFRTAQNATSQSILPPLGVQRDQPHLPRRTDAADRFSVAPIAPLSMPPSTHDTRDLTLPIPVQRSSDHIGPVADLRSSNRATAETHILPSLGALPQVNPLTPLAGGHHGQARRFSAFAKPHTAPQSRASSPFSRMRMQNENAAPAIGHTETSSYFGKPASATSQPPYSAPVVATEPSPSFQSHSSAVSQTQVQESPFMLGTHAILDNAQESSPAPKSITSSSSSTHATASWPQPSSTQPSPLTGSEAEGSIQPAKSTHNHHAQGHNFLMHHTLPSPLPSQHPSGRGSPNGPSLTNQSNGSSMVMGNLPPLQRPDFGEDRRAIKVLDRAFI